MGWLAPLVSTWLARKPLISPSPLVEVKAHFLARVETAAFGNCCHDDNGGWASTPPTGGDQKCFGALREIFPASATTTIPMPAVNKDRLRI